MAFQLYTLDPLDTLFFRDGSAFDPGEGAEAASLFPPTPMTTQGFVRSTILASDCGRWRDYAAGCRHNGNACPKFVACTAHPVAGRIGQTTRDEGSIEVRGPWLIANKTPVVKAPLDLVADTGEMKLAVYDKHRELATGILSPGDHDATSNMPGKLRALAAPFGEKFDTVPGWIDWESFAAYLRAEPPSLELGKSWFPHLAVVEMRPGVEIDDHRKRAVDRNLYFARHLRLSCANVVNDGDFNDTRHDSVQLAIEVNGWGAIDAAVGKFAALPLGGERRAVQLLGASIATPWTTLDAAVKKQILDSGRVKIVFVQPAWFRGSGEHGWVPDGWDVNGTAKLGPISSPTREAAVWVAARMGRSMLIGGWDVARDWPKPVRRFVPPGSVFYLDAATASARAAALAMWNTCFSETPAAEPFSFDRIGVGHVFLGTWQGRNHVDV